MKFSQPRSSEVPESFKPIEEPLAGRNRFSGTSGNSMPPENHSVILTKRCSENKRSLLGKSWLLLKDGWSIQVIHRRYTDNATLLVETKNSSRKIFRILLSDLEYLDIKAPRSTCFGVIMAKTESSTFEKCLDKISFSESENSDITIGKISNYKLLFAYLDQVERIVMFWCAVF